MRASGYQITIHATINVTFDDDAIHPVDGNFYLKSIQCEDDDDETKILSTFADGSEKVSHLGRSLVLADFWEENIEFSWHKDDEDFDYWVVNVRGELIIEPLNPPEDWFPGDGTLALLELEFRRDGDSPPESFHSTNLIEGWVEDVTAMIKDEDDDWVEQEDDE